MSPRTFLILLVATVVGVVAAAGATLNRPGNDQHERAGALAFPALAADVNAVQEVRIESAEGGVLTLSRRGTDWFLKERDGYPVKSGEVNRLAVTASEMTFLAAKTQKPENYVRLGLEDPKAPGSKSIAVQFMGPGGKVLADVVVGTSRAGLEGQADGGLYLRFLDSPQTWLAKGEMKPGREVRDWIKRDLVELETGRIARVVVEHADGERVEVIKDQKTDPHFILLGIPDGAAVRDAFSVDGVASTVGNFIVDDVKTPEKLTLPEKPAVRLSYETFDGIQLRAEMFKRAGLGGAADHWVRFKVSGVKGKSGEQQANEMAEALEPWVFRIADFRFTAIGKRMSELVE